jgi:PAS domain S-box-containing protein
MYTGAALKSAARHRLEFSYAHAPGFGVPPNKAEVPIIMATPDSMSFVNSIHILLVEDSATHVALICDALAVQGRKISLTIADSLAEARARLADSRPDLAIVDLILPDGSGTELLPTVKEDASFPIVILTSQGNEQRAVDAMKGGALDYLVKSPETLAALPHAIKRALREWSHITERKRAEEALRESEERFRNLVETTSDWVWEVDDKGVFTYASPKVDDILGYRPNELLGKTPFDLMPPDEARHAAETFRATVTARAPISLLENTNLSRSGSRVVLEKNGVPVFDAAGNLRGYRGIDRDITERKRVEEELREANRELDAFVHTVSHDLRSPLTPVVGYTAFLREHYRERLDGQAVHALTQIDKQVQKMLGLLEDLLALARVGKLECPAEPVDCNEVVREVMVGLVNRLVTAGLTVEKGHLPPLRIPKNLLFQLFDNLIGNAVRYAGSAGGPIEVGGTRRGERVLIHVRDHGPGIPEAERDRVFDLFYRGSGGKEIEGTGVGLATVRKIARLYGGRAWAEETPRGGCTFRVELGDGERDLQKADELCR